MRYQQGQRKIIPCQTVDLVGVLALGVAATQKWHLFKGLIFEHLNTFTTSCVVL